MENSATTTVTVTLAGSRWLLAAKSGGLPHVPANTVIDSVTKLVNICNKYKIRIENKDAIAEHWAVNLIF